MVTNNSSNIPTAASGKVLQGAGAGSALTFSTPTYPSASGTSGKILISDGTNNVYSTPTYPATAGASGNVLTSDGTNWTSAAPVVGTGNLVLLSSQTASNSASLVFTSVITSTYTKYFLTYDNMTSAGTLELTFSTDNGATYITTNYSGGLNYWAYTGGTINNTNSTSFIPFYTAVSKQGAGFLYLYNMTRAVIPIASGMSFGNGNMQFSGGSNTTTSGVNAIKIVSDLGNIATGTFTLYGIKES